MFFNKYLEDKNGGYCYKIKVILSELNFGCMMFFIIIFLIVLLLNLNYVFNYE